MLAELLLHLASRLRSESRLKALSDVALPRLFASAMISGQAPEDSGWISCEAQKHTLVIKPSQASRPHSALHHFSPISSFSAVSSEQQEQEFLTYQQVVGSNPTQTQRT